jgi:hypothetical protein
MPASRQLLVRETDGDIIDTHHRQPRQLRLRLEGGPQDRQPDPPEAVVKTPIPDAFRYLANNQTTPPPGFNA